MLTLKLSRYETTTPMGAFPTALLEIEYTADGWEAPATAAAEADCRLLDLYKNGGAMLASAIPFVECLAEEIQEAKGTDAANDFIAEWNMLAHQKLSPIGSNEEQS